MSTSSTRWRLNRLPGPPWFVFISSQGPPASGLHPPPASCQPITVPLCGDLSYTETVLPNLLGHATQEEARAALQAFASLMQVGCSTQLKPFLCSVYTPKCVSGSPRPPCRAQCEQARTGCGSLMKRIGSQWPEALRCEAFPTESCEHVSPTFYGG